MNILNLLTEQEINNYVKYRTYNSNQVVFDEQAICTTLGIIIEGEIIIKTYTYNGKGETITIIKENDAFGQFLLFSKEPFYLGIAITNKKTKVAFINKDNLVTIFSENKKFLEQYLSMICTESVNIKQQAKLLAHKNIRDRIMFYFKQHHTQGSITIDSVTCFANILSIPRPSLSRELSKMEQEGIIKRIDKTIYLKTTI